MATIQQIEHYVSQNTRNKIIFTTDAIAGITYTNVGMSVSTLLQQEPQFYSSLITQFFNTVHHKHSSIGRYLALENIGILFEPELKLNIRGLLDTNSQNQCLIIKSEATVQSNQFHWLSPEDNINISLEGLSYIKL